MGCVKDPKLIWLWCFVLICFVVIWLAQLVLPTVWIVQQNRPTQGQENLFLLGLKSISYKFIENGLKCTPPGHQLGPLQKEFLQHYRNASNEVSKYWCQLDTILTNRENLPTPLGGVDVFRYRLLQLQITKPSKPCKPRRVYPALTLPSPSFRSIVVYLEMVSESSWTLWKISFSKRELMIFNIDNI